jgi:hypothetical protein
MPTKRQRNNSVSSLSTSCSFSRGAGLLVVLLISPSLISAAQDGMARKVPHRRRDGRIKVRLTPKVFQRLHRADDMENDDNNMSSDVLSRALHERNRDNANHSLNSHTSNDSNLHHDNWRSAVSFLLPRGLLLLAIAAVTLIKPDLAPTSIASTQQQFLGSSLSQQRKFWTDFWKLIPFRLSISWSKLLPQHNQLTVNNLTTSILSAMLIVWVPTLAMQGAWLELTFLGASLSCNSKLRWYTQYELWPAALSTIQKLFWGEVWRHVWEFVLDPFPSNVLVPNRQHKKEEQTGVQNSHELPGDDNAINSSFTDYVSSYASDLWLRIHVRVDKMTSTLIKKTVEKTVQFSVQQFLPSPWSTEISVTNTCSDEAAQGLAAPSSPNTK